MKHLVLLKTFRPKIFFFGLSAIAVIVLSCVFLFPNLVNTKNLTAKEVLPDKIIAIDPGHGATP